MRRALSIVTALVALIILSPLMLIAAIGVALTSRGPVFYRAKRLGRGRRPFTMLKFRSMRVRPPNADGSPITADRDPRVTKWGALLRATKIDELPQLINILAGNMDLIGPRPEDPVIVAEGYQPWYRESFAIRPGLASPGSIHHYSHGDGLLGADSTVRDYFDRVLPLKIALDLVHVRKASVAYDLRLVLRAAWVVIGKSLGRRRFRSPPELDQARAILAVANAQTAVERDGDGDAPAHPFGLSERCG